MLRNHRRIFPFLLCVALPFAPLNVVGASELAPIFAENFDGGQSSLAKWKGKSLNCFEVNSAGFLVGDNRTDRPGIGVRSPELKQKDLRAKFRFNLVDSRGVQFKLNYSGGGHIGRFIIESDGFYFQANKNRPLGVGERVNFAPLEADVATNVWHEFEIVLRGDTITGTLDGDQSTTYQYAHLDNEIGTFELSVMGNLAMFDDIVIHAIKSPSRTVGHGSQDEAGAPSQPSLAGRHARPSPRSRPVPRSGKSAETLSNRVAWSSPLQPFIESNCLDCHDESSAEGNLNLQILSRDLSDAEAMRRWVRVFDRVAQHEMPPKDYGEPDREDKQTFLALLHDTLVTSHASQLETVFRRLNRAEYENTVNDLFGIDVQLAEMLPEDATKHGFDNNGEALSLSAELIEIYLEAASLVLDRAIGPSKEPDRIAISKTPRELIQDSMYVKWTKLIENDEGTVVFCSGPNAATKLTRFKVPTEGTYRFRFHVKTYQSDEPVMMQCQTGQMLRNGKKRFMGYYTVPPQGSVVEFTDRMSPGESVYPRPFGTLPNIMSFKKRGEHKIEEYEGPGLLISEVEIEGPLEPWPPKSRSRLLGKVDLDSGTPADAEVIFRRFLPRAFRRVPRTDEIEKYTAKFRELMESGRSFEESLRWTLRAALCSPEFLFLDERTQSRRENEGTEDVESPAVAFEFNEAGDTEPPIDSFALASRLSYFLWSSMPDEELLRLAYQKKLGDPVVLREQTERLLRSNQSRAFTENFASQWLDLRDIDATSPDTKLYSEFDELLKRSMVEETKRTFEEMVQKNESVRDFIDSDWIIVNERLARHYGIEGVIGNEFRRVPLSADSVRGGVMTQASVLKVTANGANTSPVTRGFWMLENIMGIHPPPPPPNIPAVVPDVTGANTLRQLLETHRSVESCNGCHRLIDPPGFALEEFDAIGSWRKKYRFQGSRTMLPVDSSGVSAGGEPFQGIRDYKRLVMEDIDQVSYGLAEKLMTYATGRGMGFSDREPLKEIVSQVKHSNYGFRDLIHEVVQSERFRTP